LFSFAEQSVHTCLAQRAAKLTYFRRVVGTKIAFWDTCTGNDVYSGDRNCANDRYNGLKSPDVAILVTVSGITAIADKKLEILIKKKVESEAPSYSDHTANKSEPTISELT